MEAQKKINLETLARDLSQAWLDDDYINDIDLDSIPENWAQSYFVQDQMVEKIAALVSGWKVGMTNQIMQAYAGCDPVASARIFKPFTWVGNKQHLTNPKLKGGRVEVEFAFQISKDIPIRENPWTKDEILSLVTFHPAIEIIGSRLNLPHLSDGHKALLNIADNASGVGFIFGDSLPFTQWQDIDFKTHPINLVVDKKPAAENFSPEMRCQPIEIIIGLINHLQCRGLSLHAGEFISTGAAATPQPFEHDSIVKADYGVLGKMEIQFAL